ncbi:hypothetical protein M0R45_025358 [Rubus argutus]|uniref:Pentatricopeptide repeat-containing protein n=1 Tax=Rubus argutus TaxID=59490 RepID=A0AAW1WV88_RUBAR
MEFNGFWVKHTCVDAHIQKIGYTLHVHLGFAYIYMYAKCGSLNAARMIVKQTIDPNVVLLILTMEAVRLFKLMIKEGIKPNEDTFMVVLNVYSHAGFIEKACKYLSLMKEVYCIKP